MNVEAPGWVEGEVRFVPHRGHMYAQTFTATWRREDGLEVVIRILVDEDRGPIPRSVTITNPNGIGGDDYRQPISSMTRLATVAADMSTWGEENQIVQRRMGPTKRTDHTRLERVADLYTRALSEGRTVTELIELEENVGRKTAYDLISRARKAGLLPPSPPGRKAKERS